MVSSTIKMSLPASMSAIQTDSPLQTSKRSSSHNSRSCHIDSEYHHTRLSHGPASTITLHVCGGDAVWLLMISPHFLLHFPSLQQKIETLQAPDYLKQASSCSSSNPREIPMLASQAIWTNLGGLAHFGPIHVFWACVCVSHDFCFSV